MRRRDIERLMPFYAPDIVYFDVVPPLRYTGHAAVRRNFQRWFDGWLITHEHVSLPVEFKTGAAVMDLVP